MHQSDPEPHSSGATEAFARAAQAGAPAGFSEAWQRVAPAVYAWGRLHVRAPLRSRLDPDDLLQEVACRAWKAFDRWDPDKGLFRQWLFGIARNVLREALRRCASEPRATSHELLGSGELVNMPDSATALTQAVARDEGLHKLITRMESLPDDERRLVLFCGCEGLTHSEVAVILAITPDAVAKRWQRLCDRLRKEPRWDELLSA